MPKYHLQNALVWPRSICLQGAYRFPSTRSEIVIEMLSNNETDKVLYSEAVFLAVNT